MNSGNVTKEEGLVSCDFWYKVTAVTVPLEIIFQLMLLVGLIQRCFTFSSATYAMILVVDR